MAFLGSIPAKDMPEGSAWTWFVYTTAMLNSSAILLSLARNWPSRCWRSERLAAADEIDPEVGHDAVDDQNLEGFLGEFARERVRALSIISWVNVRATRMLSRTASESRLNRSAIWTMRSALNVPSVSMKATLAQPPPSSRGSWVVTARVWQIWVLPHLRWVRRGVRRMHSCVSRWFRVRGLVPPFAVHLGDAARGYTAAEDDIEGVSAGPDVDGVLPLRAREAGGSAGRGGKEKEPREGAHHGHPLLCRHKAPSLVFREELVGSLEHLVNLGIGEALDVDEGLLGHRQQGLDGRETRVFYFLRGRKKRRGWGERARGISERAGGASARAMGHGEARANLDVGGGHAALLELVDEDEGLRELLEGFLFLCELSFRACSAPQRRRVSSSTAADMILRKMRLVEREGVQRDWGRLWNSGVDGGAREDEVRLARL